MASEQKRLAQRQVVHLTVAPQSSSSAGEAAAASHSKCRAAAWQQQQGQLEDQEGDQQGTRSTSDGFGPAGCISDVGSSSGCGGKGLGRFDMRKERCC